MGELSFAAWKGNTEAPLHVLFLIHIILIHWSHLGGWAGFSLLYQDLFLLLCLLWAIHDRRTLHPVFLAMLLNVVSVILDIVVLSVWFPAKVPVSSTPYTTNRFAAVMAIFHLIFRAISTAVLFTVSKTRDDFDGTVATNRSAVDGGGGGAGRPISQISNNNGSFYMGESPYHSSKPTIVHQPHVMRANPEKQGNLPPIPPSYTVHN